MLANYDQEQGRLMKEECIEINVDDKPIKPVSKFDSHLMANINNGLLHRAFSVFLFSNDKLLLQQRASEKITFPDYWTNTCCSHPLYNDAELQEEKYLGVKLAARRKLEQELGILPSDIDLDKFEFLTRIHYKSSYDETWGEHEIDYILIYRTENELKLNLNPNEVCAIKYVDRQQLKDMSNDKSVILTPWFQLIMDNFLPGWWDSLTNLKSDDKIHRF